jgi:hypothetical protein
MDHIGIDRGARESQVCVRHSRRRVLVASPTFSQFRRNVKLPPRRSL